MRERAGIVAGKKDPCDGSVNAGLEESKPEKDSCDYIWQWVTYSHAIEDKEQTENTDDRMSKLNNGYLFCVEDEL